MLLQPFGDGLHAAERDRGAAALSAAHPADAQGDAPRLRGGPEGPTWESQRGRPVRDGVHRWVWINHPRETFEI